VVSLPFGFEALKGLGISILLSAWVVWFRVVFEHVVALYILSWSVQFAAAPFVAGSFAVVF
ncbi:hypothetical protein U1Q18_037669, partial [Sarracenia purpurea var. burkii]